MTVNKGTEQQYGRDTMASDGTFEETLQAARRGEEWAWQEIYMSLSGSLVGYLTMKGSPDPEDEASETLLQVARRIDTFDGDAESFRSWVFVIAHRRLIDARRRRGRRPEMAELRFDHAGETGDVEKEAIDRMSTEEIAAMLDVLTDDQREVIALRMLADFSLEQTADVMGKRVGAIKALQRRAIGRLRRHFESLGVSR